jgi:hypothetical protein
MDQLATDCFHEKYHLSAMKFNPQTDKNTYTIKDGSTPLKQAFE